MAEDEHQESPTQTNAAGARSLLVPDGGPRWEVVGISEMRVSVSKDEVLATYSLGSCLGVTMYDPVAKVGGMIHCMLPVSRIDPEKAEANPCMFVDTGIPALLQALFNRGARRRSLVIKVAGASKPRFSNSEMDIGRRNYTVFRKVLWKNDLLIAAEHVGGVEPCSLYLHMKEGNTILRIRGCGLEM